MTDPDSPATGEAARRASPVRRAGAGAHWLTARRLRVYAVIVLAAFAVAAGLRLTEFEGLRAPDGQPFGYDFIAFWSAAELALGGEPAAAYLPERIAETGARAVPGMTAPFIWSYPPTYLLVVQPLALLPYLWAYALWSLIGALAFLAVARRLAPAPETVLLALAFPGTLLNLAQGQNGLLIAALFGGAMALLRPRPVLAGVLIGLMSFKPQLGLLLPIALLCGRQWRAFAAATLTTLAFAATALAVYGGGAWLAFWENLAFATRALEEGGLPWAKMPSLFAALRLLGLGVPAAYGAQALLAIAVAGAVGAVWWRRAPGPLAAAVLAGGALLVFPHVNDHDLALAGVPIALLAWHGHRHGWMRGEREILVLAWAMPMVAAQLALASGVQAGVLVSLALFAVALRRALAWGSEASAPR